MLGWITRCLPGFSIIGLLLLLVCAFSDILQSEVWRSFFPPTNKPAQGPWSGLNIAQRIFVAYALLIHVHMLGFTLRLGWSIFRATGKAKLALERRIWHTPLPSPQYEGDEYIEQPISPVSAHSMDSLISKNLKADVTVNEVVEEELVHAIILPNYCEDLHTLETTLKVLASHPRARSQYEIYLAMEQKEDASSDKAGHLVTKFEKSFLHICGTFHPSGIQGEIAGKSSNVAFAARRIVEIHRTDLNEDCCNVVVTVMDGKSV
jgi:hypothetical protein